MAIKTFNQKQKTRGHRAQAMVEFAIALPVLMALLVGIMEVGRMVFMYALVVNASRDAVRYASAVGKTDDGLYYKYKNCLYIKGVAQKSAYIVPIPASAISITYTDKDGLNPQVCDRTTIGDDDIIVKSGYRVTVTVQANYSPIIKLIPLGTRTFTSTSSRTILGIFELPNK